MVAKKQQICVLFKGPLIPNPPLSPQAQRYYNEAWRQLGQTQPNINGQNLPVGLIQLMDYAWQKRNEESQGYKRTEVSPIVVNYNNIEIKFNNTINNDVRLLDKTFGNGNQGK